MIRKSWIRCDRVITFMLPLGKILFRSSTPGGRDRTLLRVSRGCSRDRQTNRRPCLSIGQQHRVGPGPSTCSRPLHLPLSTCTTTEHPRPPPDLQARPHRSARGQRHHGRPHVVTSGEGRRQKAQVLVSEIPVWTITSLHGDFILGVGRPSAEWGRNAACSEA